MGIGERDIRERDMRERDIREMYISETVPPADSISSY
jgi:hypothetical protein